MGLTRRNIALIGMALGLTLAPLPFAHAQSPEKPAATKDAGKKDDAKKNEIQVDALTLTIIIKSVIIALHQANVTGNYSVLHDLGTPVFRERFNQARLTEIFANLRNQAINLGPVIVLAPSLTRQPQLTAQRQLQIEGFFPTQPLQIRFTMVVQLIDGVWRLDGLAVDAVPAQAQAAVQPPQTPQSAPAPSRNTAEGKAPPAAKKK